MHYNIAAKPTRYNGVEFRSRLEARWAAFFDLCGWRWDYEPIDLQGWVPDFKIKIRQTNIFTEVKPVDIDTRDIDKSFLKALAHWESCQVLLLGLAPINLPGRAVGRLLDCPLQVEDEWFELHQDLCLDSSDPDQLWREAGNMTRWHP